MENIRKKLTWLKKHTTIKKYKKPKYKKLRNLDDDDILPDPHETYKKYSQPDLTQSGKGKIKRKIIKSKCKSLRKVFIRKKRVRRRRRTRRGKK